MIVARLRALRRALAQRAAAARPARRALRRAVRRLVRLLPDLPTCEQLKFDGFYWGAHVFDNYAVYLSFIAFPAQAIPLEPDTLRWCIAIACRVDRRASSSSAARTSRASASSASALALLPFAPVEIWTASRYTYAAVAFFAPVAAIAAYELYDRVRNTHHYVRIPATLVGLLFVAAVAGLYSWQTFARDRMSGERTDRWQLLANELERNYDTVPPGTTIWIVDGPWTNPMEQYTWVPSVARALYGDARAFNLPRAAFAADPPSTENALFLEWDGSGLEPHRRRAGAGPPLRPGVRRPLRQLVHRSSTQRADANLRTHPPAAFPRVPSRALNTRFAVVSSSHGCTHASRRRDAGNVHVAKTTELPSNQASSPADQLITYDLLFATYSRQFCHWTPSPIPTQVRMAEVPTITSGFSTSRRATAERRAVA